MENNKPGTYKYKYQNEENECGSAVYCEGNWILPNKQLNTNEQETEKSEDLKTLFEKKCRRKNYKTWTEINFEVKTRENCNKIKEDLCSVQSKEE